MTESVHEKIMRSLQDAESLYHRLVLLVGRSGSGKTRILQDVARAFDVSIININLALSSKLLELTARQRLLRVQPILAQVTDQAQSPVVLDNTEFLFDKSLQQNPLSLLQSVSRNRTVLASWSGTLHSGILMYAENGHPEYRCYDSIDALIVSMDG